GSPVEHRNLRPPCREAARGTHARSDRPSLRPARGTRRRRHPGVRRTRSTARRRSLGAGLARTATAVPTTVLSGRNSVRRKPLYWNRRTAPAFSYLRPIDAGNEGLVDQTGVEPFERVSLTE